MSKFKFRVFILIGLLILPIFTNAQVRNVSTTGTMVKGSYEETLLNLVNEARRNAGVSELKLDKTLTNIARQRAIEIGSYFGGNHLRPTLVRYTDIFNEFGFKYKYCGENLAYGFTSPQDVFDAWFNSDDHRKNILNPNYDSLGLGVFKVNYNGRIYHYWAQNFSDSSSEEYIPSNQHIEDYGNYVLKYDDSISDVTFNEISDVSLNIGDSQEINYFVNGKNEIPNMEVKFKLLDWNSSNSDVISITRNNDIVTMTAVGAGVSTISTTYKDRDISFVVNVEGQNNVDDSYILYNLNYNSDDTRIDISNSQDLSTLILDVDGISRNSITQFYNDGEIANKSPINIKYCHDDTCITPIDYVSDDIEIVEYIQNNLIFNKSGRTTITAFFENGLGVKIPVEVVLFRFDEHEYSVNVGEDISSSIITNMQEEYSYRSLNPEVATIDDNGKISGVNPGIAYIKCISDSGFVTMTKVNVLESKEIRINIDEHNIEFVEGENSIIKYSVIPHNANISFVSSDESVVTVDNDGNLHGVRAGSATITMTATTEYGSSSEIVNVVVKQNPVIDIILSKNNINLQVGQTTLINANVVPDNASDKSLTWKSSDETIAEVDSNGKITAKLAGNAVITVASGNGVSKSIAVSVTEKDAEKPVIEVDKESVELSIGDAHFIHITVDSDRELTLYSDDPSIADINSQGMITAISAGTTTIHITTNLGEEILINVQVNPKVPISSITLNHESITLIEGESITIEATINPENTTDILDLVWISNNEDVATVSENGKITAISEGTTTVVVISVNGVRSEVLVNVTKRRIPISDIEIDEDDIVLGVGDQKTINVNIIPSDTTDDLALAWSSSDEGIALVDNNGKITAIHEGYVTITVTTTNGISHDIKVLVTENSIPITKIEVEQKNIELEEGEFTSIITSIYPTNTTLSKVLAWESSDMNVVTVDKDGKITAVNKGSAMITVTSVNGISETIYVTVYEKRIPISSITLEKDKYILYVGDDTTINALVFPENTTDSKILTWQSNNSDVLSVDSNGRVHANNVGRAIVTITSVNGITAQVQITVLDSRILEIKLNIHDIELKDDKQEIKIESYLPVDSNLIYDLIEWSTSNPNVAVVRNNKIIPIGYGEAFITARYGDVSDTCRVVVPSSIQNGLVGTLYDDIKKYDNGDSKNVLANTSDVLGITLSPEIQELFDLYNIFQISWESSDESILKVENGNIRFLKPGRASVTVKFGIYNTTLYYNIYDIDVNIHTSKINVGDSIQITTTIHSPTTSGLNAIYTISDSSIASIDINGVITGIKSGVATVYVYSSDGAIYKTFNIEILEKNVSNQFDVVFDKNEVVINSENNAVILVLSDITKSLSESEKKALINSNEDIIAYYNIAYLKSDNTLNNEALYNVSIPLDYDKTKYSSVYVAYVEDGKVVKIISSRTENGYIKFTTSHDGNFLLVGILNSKDNENFDTEEYPEIPNTSSNITGYIASWVIALLTLSLLITTTVVKKKND